MPNGSVFETVFDPLGRVAGYSLLGTDHSGRGHVEVRRPTPGTWTAVIFTINTPARKYRGSVQFDYFTQRFQTTGVVSPQGRTLAPGQSGTRRPTAIPTGWASRCRAAPRWRR